MLTFSEYPRFSFTGRGILLCTLLRTYFKDEEPEHRGVQGLTPYPSACKAENPGFSLGLSNALGNTGLLKGHHDAQEGETY